MSLFGLKVRSWYIIVGRKKLRKYISANLTLSDFCCSFANSGLLDSPHCMNCLKYQTLLCLLSLLCLHKVLNSFSHLSLSLCFSLLSLFIFFFGGVPWISEAVQEAEQEDVKVVVDAQAPKPTKKTKAAAASCQSSSTRKEKKGKHKG